MINREYTYKKAFENKAQRLKAKTQKREAVLKAAYLAEPRLSEIDQKLSNIGSTIAITALSGNSDKLEALKRDLEDLLD